jgi:thiol:disulfide interchange protein DsbC
MLRHAILALMGAISLSACAAEPGAAVARPAAAKGARPAATAAKPAAGTEAAIRAALAEAVPGVAIDRIQASLIPGYQEVVLGGRVIYVSNDGKYLMQGTLLRLADRVDMTDASEAVLRRDAINAVGADRRIVFAAAKPRHKVTVFTDIDCGYCRKLHSQIADYNARGITVEYLFFPRAGINSESFDKAVNVWCAPNRQKALTDAKADRDVTKRTCANPIAAEFNLGQKIGVDGTPAIYLDDGTQIGGYLPPDEMLKELDKQARRRADAKGAALAGN